MAKNEHPVESDPITNESVECATDEPCASDSGPDENQTRAIRSNLETLSAAADIQFALMAALAEIARQSAPEGPNRGFSKYLSIKYGYNPGVSTDEERLRHEMSTLLPLKERVEHLQSCLVKLDFGTDGLTFYSKYKLPRLSEISYNMKYLDRFVTWALSDGGKSREDREISTHLGVLEHSLRASNRLGLNYRLAGRNIVVGPAAITQERQRLCQLMGLFSRNAGAMGEAMFVNRKFQEWYVESKSATIDSMFTVFGDLADRLGVEKPGQNDAPEPGYPGGYEFDVGLSRFGKSGTQESDTSSDGSNADDTSTTSRESKPMVLVANKGDGSPTDRSADGFGSSTPSPPGPRRGNVALMSKKSNPRGGPRARKDGALWRRDFWATGFGEPGSLPRREPVDIKKQKTQHSTDATKMGTSAMGDPPAGIAEGMTFEITEREGDIYKLKLLDCASDSGSEGSSTSATEGVGNPRGDKEKKGSKEELERDSDATVEAEEAAGTKSPQANKEVVLIRVSFTVRWCR